MIEVGSVIGALADGRLAHTDRGIGLISGAQRGDQNPV